MSVPTGHLPLATLEAMYGIAMGQRALARWDKDKASIALAEALRLVENAQTQAKAAQIDYDAAQARESAIWRALCDARQLAPRA